MKNEKITYIIGAGASIGAFPIVKSTDKWRGLANELINSGIILGNRFLKMDPPKYRETVKVISDALKQTGINAEEFGNVDSYAKYLYHTDNKEDLGKLKIALAYFFTNKQICFKKGLEEKRYLNFITSLINEQGMFPEQVKILNWNYDYLFEIASAYYKQEEFSESNGSTHHSPAFVNYFPNYGYEFNLTHSEYVKETFSLVHLNGIAGFYVEKNEKGNKVFKSIFNDASKTNKEFSEIDLIMAFHNYLLSNSHLITFAWEKDSETKNYLVNNYKIAEQIVKDTSILVVIGYSFPFYNREVDNMVFRTIKPSLKKIYFQDPSIDGEFLRKRYGMSKELSEDEIELKTKYGIKTRIVDVEHISYTDQFYVPIEV